MRSLPLLLALALLAGCFGGAEVPNEQTFAASGGRVTAGWAYDGAGVLAEGAALTGSTDDAANTGAVDAEFVLDGQRWTVRFDRFSQAEGKTFQDGGIAHALDEHGDTGVADASIPRIHALVAAWGSATVTRDGAPVTAEPWTAHLMVSRDTVRGADGKILKADGATPYDPATPGDARRVENDPQAFLFIKHPMGETYARGAVPVGANLTCQGPQCDQSAELVLDADARQLDLNVTFVPAGAVPLATGRATVTLLDAEGGVLHQGEEVRIVPGAPVVSSISVPLEGVPGPLTLRVVGDGAFVARAEGTVAYVDHPFLVITWDDVQMG